MNVAIRICFILASLSTSTAIRDLRAQPPSAHDQALHPLQDTVASGWTLQQSGTTARLSSVSFINKDTGWVGGEAAFQQPGGILHTTDGGDHWLPWGPEGGYSEVQFVDANTGWITGNFMPFLGTKDGGLHWDTLKGAVNAQHILLLNRDTGYAVGLGISHTFNGGKSWTNHGVRMNEVNAIVSLSPSHLLAFGTHNSSGTNGTARSLDGGASWDTIPFVNMKSDFWGACNADSSTVVASGPGGLIVRSTNGGDRWIKVADSLFGAGEVFHGIVFANRDTGVAFGDDGLLYCTSNAGVSWIRQIALLGPDRRFGFYGGTFCDSRTLVLVGDGGAILKSTNAGYSWVQPQVQPQNLEIRAFPDPGSRSVTLTYSLPLAQHVTCDVYDTGGRLIARLLSSVLQWAGLHSVLFDGSRLPNGVYTYQFSTERFRVSGKLSIIR